MTAVLNEIEEFVNREEAAGRNPTTSDIQNGQALNALFDDLADPDISSADWYTKVVPLATVTATYCHRHCATVRQPVTNWTVEQYTS